MLMLVFQILRYFQWKYSMWKNLAALLHYTQEIYQVIVRVILPMMQLLICLEQYFQETKEMNKQIKSYLINQLIVMRLTME